MQSIGEYQYRPGELIGHGAFALVFKGQHRQTRQAVAIKQILLKNIPGKLSTARQDEISILKDLKHPNIVQLYHYEEMSNEIYLIMEFCNGGDLAEYLQKMKTLSEESIRHLIKNISNALQVIHKRRIIHRDIKPQNLLLSYPPNKTPAASFQSATIKLADFGFARYLNGADMAATLCGSPLYMAPEILLGHRYDNKADLWSTGTILYQCLTGRAPFEASNPHALRRRYARETLVPRIPEGVSPKLADLLLKLLKKNVQERISHSSLITHPFLQPESNDDKISLPDQSLPSLHAKSSPVPIKRRQSSSRSITSPYTSPLGSGSLGHKRCSPSSGPPVSHAIGSTIQSPPTKDLEDFVLVGATAESTSSRLSPSSQGSKEGSSSQYSPSSPHFSSICGPLSELRQTPPSSLSPSSIRRDTPPFSSLVKLGIGTQYIVSPSSFQATPPLHSKSSSPISRPGFSPVGGASQRSSRQNSFTKLTVLFEQKDVPQPSTTPTTGLAMCDSTELISQSLLMGSDTNNSDKGFNTLLNNEIPHRKAEELQESPGNGRGLFIVGQESPEPRSLESPEPRPLDDWTSEEMFSLQLDEVSALSKGVSSLSVSIAIAQELLKLAKSRQGPMLLLSSSIGDSGRVLDHAQRFSEQLVLCVKAAKVIEDGFKEYELELAAASLEPEGKHSKVIEEARSLQKHCLQKGQVARELYSKCLTKRRQQQPSQHKTVIAEKLIFWQAVDMCKQAMLEEGTLNNEEIIRRYHLSLLLFQLLSSDAKTHGDRTTIKRYEGSISERLKSISTKRV
ncbi:PREDICTED: serine/threonine-protein kinase ULK1-like [Amphimedon queenslandica]|uniref:Protein kinase domain-containing protein n=1 Tax=Amphimedon queenslandica TaxID=400682 RepID=A0A1X7VHH2_AMPQE|nr:PREDICTED: serine/threonine-protein kinase ULK1-like [Amphimedon queenslandica]|eukprot:XP_003384166.1 PREDICTED: serine/threonine-protein kinase ULK1-like [Amphimedon queenslandica]